jgi:hypothetical protein
MTNMQTLPSPNQIWYTSTDRAIINPSARYFSAVIVSNSYDEGWGIITFNRPLTEVGWNAFLECQTLEGIVFPAGVIEIAEGACQNCKALTKVVIPDSVTKIGAKAFAGCDSLMKISLPESCVNIGQDAFDSHTQITRHAKSMPAEDEIWYTAVGNQAIEFRERLTDAAIVSNNYQNGVGIVKFDKAISAIQKSAFYDCTTLTSITLPKSVIRVADYAFSGCTSLINITLPDSVESLGVCSFEGCSTLKTLQLGDGIKQMGEYAFARCSALKSFTVPQAVTTISEGLLSGCSGVTKLYLGSSVVDIEPYAFEHCNIVGVYLNSTTPKFGAQTLRMSTGMKLYVPHSAVETFKQHEGWQQYAERICGYEANE